MHFFTRRYFEKKVLRKYKRKQYLKNDANLIEKNQNSKILVILHLFYPRSWFEIRQYLLNLEPYNWDLVVTYPENLRTDTDMMKSLKLIEKFKKNVRLISCPNQGYDIGPFIFALKSIDVDAYDILFKIQSKGVFRRKIYIYKQLFKNREWFLNLFEGILGAHNVHLVVDKLYNNNTIDLAAAENLFVHDPKHKQNLVNKRLKQFLIKLPQNYSFVAGTCFAVKPSKLKEIMKLNLSLDDFRQTPASRGLSLAHAIERLMGTTDRNNFFGTKVGKKHYLRKVEESFYERHSAEVLLQKYKINDEFFFQNFDNRMVKIQKKNVQICDLGVISAVTNKYQPISDTAPYKYLMGDVEGYEKYSQYHIEHELPLMTRTRFDTLISSIEEHGFDNNSPILVQEKNIILDGQHRACILAKLNGLEHEIQVLQVVVLNKKWIVKKILPNYVVTKYFRHKFQY